jgi:hypothetical protein
MGMGSLLMQVGRWVGKTLLECCLTYSPTYLPAGLATRLEHGPVTPADEARAKAVRRRNRRCDGGGAERVLYGKVHRPTGSGWVWLGLVGSGWVWLGEPLVAPRCRLTCLEPPTCLPARPPARLPACLPACLQLQLQIQLQPGPRGSRHGQRGRGHLRPLYLRQHGEAVRLYRVQGETLRRKTLLEHY